MKPKPPHEPGPGAKQPAQKAKPVCRQARGTRQVAPKVRDGAAAPAADGPFEGPSLARADRGRAGEESVNETETERESALDPAIEDAALEDVELPFEGEGSDSVPVPGAP